MAYRKVRCYAHGDETGWEAMCIDLDISVQGATFNEVKDLLDEAISTYVVDVSREDDATVRRLEYRRAPLHVRAGHMFGYLVHGLFFRKDDECRAGFELPCPA